jgi:hypothetical protein
MTLGDWLQKQLFERRIVLVTGPLDDVAAARAAAALLTLGASGNGPIGPIELHLDSPGARLRPRRHGRHPALGAECPLPRLDRRLRHRRGLGRGSPHRSAAHAVPPLQPTARFTGTPEEIAAQSRQQHRQHLPHNILPDARRRARGGRPRPTSHPRDARANLTRCP